MSINQKKEICTININATLQISLFNNTNTIYYFEINLIVIAAPPLDASFCFKTVLFVTTIVRI